MARRQIKSDMRTSLYQHHTEPSLVLVSIINRNSKGVTINEKKQIITILDYDKRWPEVIPALGTPLVQRALNTGMADLCRQRETSWDPAYGPWSYSNCDYWCERISELAEKTPEYEALVARFGESKGPEDEELEGDGSWEQDEGNGDERDEEFFEELAAIEARFYPKPNTPDWFRCSGLAIGWPPGIAPSAWN
jgi:hypothetical protein